jgi:hypothetical protein
MPWAQPRQRDLSWTVAERRFNVGYVHTTGFFGVPDHMNKNVLLAAAAVSVMAFAGAASAHTLTFRTAAAPTTDIDAGETGGATLPYKLAVEASTVTPPSAVFALVSSLSAGSTFPSGNNFIQIDLNGGTFASGLTASTVVAPGCTSVLSSGGAAGSTTAKFLISSAGGACNLANLDLPIAPNAGAEVSVTSTISTEAGAPIDPPSAATLKVLSRVNAFSVVVDSAIGAGAVGDTFATLTANPVYTEFSTAPGAHAGGGETATVGQLGTVRILVDTTAYKDLNKNLVVAADVTEAGVTVDGNYNAFNGAGGSVALGTPLTVNAAATQATLASSLAVATSLTGGPVPFIVTRETANTAIPSSTYKATISYKLLATAYNQEGPVVADLETIGRDGTNVVFPWMNSSSVQGATGTSNIIRLGNISGSASGPVYAQVLNSVNSGAGYTAATAPVQLFPNIAANGERVINTATLTAALGEFGRGDVQISVEAPSGTVTARRYATLANGSVTELNSGTVASDQNQVNVP